MPTIQISSEQLGSRGNWVRQLLQPLAKMSGGPAWQPKILRGEYIIGTHQGSPAHSDYREWRFASIVPGLRVMYFERWMELDDELWCLDRAYLSLFRAETELLCLHCDPDEPDGAASAVYKRGPHLHVSVAPDPIRHAHIALNRGHLETVLSSLDSLSEAMRLAILMLKEEVLDAFQ